MPRLRLTDRVAAAYVSSLLDLSRLEAAADRPVGE